MCTKYSILYYFRSTEVNEVKLVLQTVNYSRNTASKFGRKIQNHWDNNAFCAMESFILLHAPCRHDGLDYTTNTALIEPI